MDGYSNYVDESGNKMVIFKDGVEVIYLTNGTIVLLLKSYSSKKDKIICG